MTKQFDDLAKALAGGMSRRTALRRFGITVLGALGAAGLRGPFGKVWAARDPNSACAHFCNMVFGEDTPQADQCISQAAHHTGPCYECGPAAPAVHPPLCGQVCCSSSSDVCCPTASGQVCCPSTSTCIQVESGQCVCM